MFPIIYEIADILCIRPVSSTPNTKKCRFSANREAALELIRKLLCYFKLKFDVLEKFTVAEDGFLSVRPHRYEIDFSFQ